MSAGGSQDEKALQAFKKCLNVQLTMAIALKLNYNEDQLNELRNDLVERLTTVARYKDAADVLIQIPDYSIQQVVELYSKANEFMAAVKESMRAPADQRERMINIVRASVNLAHDVRRNQILKVLDEFDKRMLRLSLV